MSAKVAEAIKAALDEIEATPADWPSAELMKAVQANQARQGLRVMGDDELRREMLANHRKVEAKLRERLAKLQ